MLGKQILCTAIPALCLTIVSAIAYLGGYRLNTTASLPAGIWKITDHYARGSYVSACIPPEAPMMAYAIKHAYLPDGICPGGFAPLLKKIAAAPGDTVRLTVDSMTVNGHSIPNTTTIEYDAAGLLQFTPRGTYPVSRGQFWLVANINPRSFDSRYFGPINSANILHGMKPVFVTRNAS